MTIYSPLKLTDFMPFGIHKGEQIEDMLYDHPGYLAWCVENEVIDFDDEVMKQLNERKII